MSKTFDWLNAYEDPKRKRPPAVLPPATGQEDQRPEQILSSAKDLVPLLKDKVAPGFLLVAVDPMLRVVGITSFDAKDLSKPEHLAHTAQEAFDALQPVKGLSIMLGSNVSDPNLVRAVEQIVTQLGEPLEIPVRDVVVLTGEGKGYRALSEHGKVEKAEPAFFEHMRARPQDFFSKQELVERAGKEDFSHNTSRRVRFQGFDIEIETHPGEERRWGDPQDHEARTVMTAPYGSFIGTVGLDGEPLDVFLGPTEGATEVYVIQQMKPPAFTELDEEDVMLGYPSAQTAKEAFLLHYDQTGFFGGLRTFSVEEFRAKLARGGFKRRVTKAKKPVNVKPYVRAGRSVSGYTEQREEGRGKTWGAGKWSAEHRREHMKRLAWDAEYQRILPKLEEAHKAASKEEQARIVDLDTDFGNWRADNGTKFDQAKVEEFVKWARSVVPGSFSEERLKPTKETHPPRVKVTPVEDPPTDVPYYHGSHATATVVMQGFESYPATKIQDHDNVYAWKRQGRDPQGEEPIAWKPYLAQWWKDLTSEQRKKVKEQVGPVGSIEELGSKVGLLWTSENPAEAARCTNEGDPVLRVDPSKLSYFGYFAPDVLSKQEFVFVVPLGVISEPGTFAEVDKEGKPFEKSGLTKAVTLVSRVNPKRRAGWIQPTGETHWSETPEHADLLSKLGYGKTGPSIREGLAAGGVRLTEEPYDDAVSIEIEDHPAAKKNAIGYLQSRRPSRVFLDRWLPPAKPHAPSFLESKQFDRYGDAIRHLAGVQKSKKPVNVKPYVRAGRPVSGYVGLRTQKDLIEAGYQAALAGQPCEVPDGVRKERDRAAWEQGWRAGNSEKKPLPSTQDMQAAQREAGKHAARRADTLKKIREHPVLSRLIHHSGNRWNLPDVDSHVIIDLQTGAWQRYIRNEITPDLKGDDLDSLVEHMKGYGFSSQTDEVEDELPDSSEIFREAKEKFGVTEDPWLAGYILPDGDMLDLSGGGGARYSDHREIGGLDAYDKVESGTDAMIHFMRQGAVRWMPLNDAANANVSLDAEPTMVQYRTMVRAAREREVPLLFEIDNSSGSTIHSQEFDRPTVEGLQRAFAFAKRKEWSAAHGEHIEQEPEPEEEDEETEKSIRGIISPQGQITAEDDEKIPGLIHAHLFKRAGLRGKNWADEGWVRFIQSGYPGRRELGVAFKRGHPAAMKNAEQIIRERGTGRIYIDQLDDNYDTTSSQHDSSESALSALKGVRAPKAGVSVKPVWVPKAASLGMVPLPLVKAEARRYCSGCEDRSRKGLKVQHAACSSCGRDTCTHLTRFSTPKVVCGRCSRRGLVKSILHAAFGMCPQCGDPLSVMPPDFETFRCRRCAEEGRRSNFSKEDLTLAKALVRVKPYQRHHLGVPIPVMGYEQRRRIGEQPIASYMKVIDPKTGEEKVITAVDPNLIQALGQSMYSSDLPKTATKEMLQNSVDSIKGLADQSKGKVTVTINSADHTITLVDTGIGMTNDVVSKEFIDVGGSFKPGAESSGAYGLAKIAIFGTSDDVDVSTVAKVGDHFEKTTLKFSGKEWMEAMNPEKANLHPHTVTVPEEPTGATIKIKLAESVQMPEDPYYVRAFLEEFLRDNLLRCQFDFSINGKPVTQEKTPRKLLTKLDVAGATLELYAADRPQRETHSITIKVLNNGLPQFEKHIYLDQDAKMPQDLLVDVHAKAGPKEPDYPFTTSREALRGAANEELEKFIKYNLAAEEIKKENAAIRLAVKNATRIKGTHARVLDTSQTLPPILVEEISNSPATKPLAKEFQKIFTAIQNRLVKLSPEYGNVDFMGIGLGQEYLGINISGPGVGKEKNIILLNPFLQAHLSAELQSGEDKPGTWARDFGEQMAACIVHELTHQVAREHSGEDADSFSNVLTRIIGSTLPLANLAAKRLAKLVDKPEIKGALLDAYSKLHDAWDLQAGKNIFDKISVSYAGSDRAPSGPGTPPDRGPAGARPTLPLQRSRSASPVLVEYRAQLRRDDRGAVYLPLVKGQARVSPYVRGGHLVSGYLQWRKEGRYREPFPAEAEITDADWGEGDLAERAKKLFGTTRDFEDAGYILPDGTMLNFGRASGMKRPRPRSEVGDPTVGVPWGDHRSVIALMTDEGRKRYYNRPGQREDRLAPIMFDFMRRTGAIRVNFLGIDARAMPTEAQVRPVIESVRKLSRFVGYENEIRLDAPYSNSVVLKRPTVPQVMDWFSDVFGMKKSFGIPFLKAQVAVKPHTRHTAVGVPVFVSGYRQQRKEGAPEPVPIFVSPLFNLLDRKMPARATVAQVQAILKEAKKEEVKWTYVEGAIKTSTDEKGLVDKQKLLDAISADYPPMVHEKIRGLSPEELAPPPPTAPRRTNAQRWDELSGGVQERVEEAWKDANRQEFYDSEVESWNSGDEPKAIGRRELLEDEEWLNDQIDAWWNDEEWWGGHVLGLPEGHPPVTLESVKAAFTLELGDGEDEYDIPSERKDPMAGLVLKVDPSRLVWTDVPDERQVEFEGFPAHDPALRWEKGEWSKDLQDFITQGGDSLYTEIERRAENVEPPEYLAESADESLAEYWSQLDDAEKWDYGVEHEIITDEDQEEVESSEEGSETRYKQYNLPWVNQPEWYHEYLFQLPNIPTTYTAPHWEEPNVIVHVRASGVDDRKVYPDPDPNVIAIGPAFKMLFIEEIQSDWAKKMKAAVTGVTVDPAPFQKTWLELAFKRMLREAVDKDMDAIGWTSGAQQTQRWESSLRKVVQKIEWRPTASDVQKKTYRLEVDENGVGSISFSVVGRESTGVLTTRSKAGVVLLSTLAPAGVDAIFAELENRGFSRETVTKLFQSKPTVENIGQAGMLTAYDHAGHAVVEDKKVETPEELANLVGKEIARKLLEQKLGEEHRYTTSLYRLKLKEPIEWPGGQVAEVTYAISNMPQERTEFSRVPGTLALFSEGGVEINSYFGIAPDKINKLFLDRATTSSAASLNEVATLLDQKPEVTESVRMKPATVEGNDLVIGGQGFVNVYDKELVQFANQYTKKWGGQVQDRDVALSDKEVPTTIHVLKITPQMKEALAKEPQMLFSRREREDLGVYLPLDSLPGASYTSVMVKANRVLDSDLFTSHTGPFGVVRVCKKCDFKVTVRTGLRGVGRGYGMREGNKARGQMIQHAKTHEPTIEKARYFDSPTGSWGSGFCEHCGKQNPAFFEPGAPTGMGKCECSKRHGAGCQASQSKQGRCRCPMTPSVHTREPKIEKAKKPVIVKPYVRRTGPVAGYIEQREAAKPEILPTPKDVDTKLSELYRKLDKATSQVQSYTGTLERYKQRDSMLYERYLKEYTPEIEKLQAEIKKIDAEMVPLHAEFERRRWSRFFLVTNGNGHVHSSMRCTTTYPTTRWAWLPELSGKTESDAVAEYGEKMCTVCFPTAPTNPAMAIYRKRTAGEKEAKAKEKAAAFAEKQAKWLSPDGRRVEIKCGLPGHEVELEATSLVTARQEITHGFEESLRCNSYAATRGDDPQHRMHLLALSNAYEEAAKKMAEAVALRTGESVETLIATAKAKAEKKHKANR